jgi:hypothetical protein
VAIALRDTAASGRAAVPPGTGRLRTHVSGQLFEFEPEGQGEGQGGPLGLSRLQTSTRLGHASGRVVVYKGGARLDLPPAVDLTGTRRGGKRRACRGMSKYAKRTGVRWFSSIDESRIRAAWFLTVTWPDDEARDAVKFKQGLERYFARLLRAYGDRLAWYWAMEPHTSAKAAGRFHAHLILLWVGNPPSLPAFRAWNDKAWWACTRCDHVTGGRYACKVEPARTWRGVRSYLVGYLAADKWSDYTGDVTGRVHGVRNRHLVPISRGEVELTPAALRLLRRACRRRDEALSRGSVTVTDETGKRGRCRDLITLRSVHPNAYRKLVKEVARASAKLGSIVRRGRRRFVRQEVRKREWDEESVVMPSGRVARRLVVREFDCEDGGPLKVTSIGRSVVTGLPSADADRLVEWASREAMRREEFERSCCSGEWLGSRWWVAARGAHSEACPSAASVVVGVGGAGLCQE